MPQGPSPRRASDSEAPQARAVKVVNDGNQYFEIKRKKEREKSTNQRSVTRRALLTLSQLEVLNKARLSRWSGSLLKDIDTLVEIRESEWVSLCCWRKCSTGSMIR